MIILPHRRVIRMLNLLITLSLLLPSSDLERWDESIWNEGCIYWGILESEEEWGQTLTKTEGVGHTHIWSGLKGNNVGKRELTGSLIYGSNWNFSVCAILQHFFWKTACTSANGGWGEMFILGQWLEGKAAWMEFLGLCSQLTAIILQIRLLPALFSLMLIPRVDVCDQDCH